MQKHILFSSHLMPSSWISPLPLRFVVSKYRLQSSWWSGPSEGPVTTTVLSSSWSSSCLWFCVPSTVDCRSFSSDLCLCGLCIVCWSGGWRLRAPNWGFFPVVTRTSIHQFTYVKQTGVAAADHNFFQMNHKECSWVFFCQAYYCGTFIHVKWIPLLQLIRSLTHSHFFAKYFLYY